MQQHYGEDYAFFIRTILQEHKAHFCSKFKNNSASAEEQSLKILVKVVNKNNNKCRTISKVDFSSRLFTYNC